ANRQAFRYDPGTLPQTTFASGRDSDDLLWRELINPDDLSPRKLRNGHYPCSPTTGWPRQQLRFKAHPRGKVLGKKGKRNITHADNLWSRGQEWSTVIGREHHINLVAPGTPREIELLPYQRIDRPFLTP